MKKEKKKRVQGPSMMHAPWSQRGQSSSPSHANGTGYRPSTPTTRESPCTLAYSLLRSACVLARCLHGITAIEGSRLLLSSLPGTISAHRNRIAPLALGFLASPTSIDGQRKPTFFVVFRINELTPERGRCFYVSCGQQSTLAFIRFRYS